MFISILFGKFSENPSSLTFPRWVFLDIQWRLIFAQKNHFYGSYQQEHTSIKIMLHPSLYITTNLSDFTYAREMLFCEVKDKGGKFSSLFFCNHFIFFCLENCLPTHVNLTPFWPLLTIHFLRQTFSFLYGRAVSCHHHFSFLYSHPFFLTAAISIWHKAYFLFMVPAPVRHKLHKKQSVCLFWFMPVLPY